MKNEQKMKLSVTIWESLLIVVLAFACALPLGAQEQSKVKLNLPDGQYHFQGGCSFIIKDNQFYTSHGALKTFGVAKLNEWFAGEKIKNLSGSERIGEGYNRKVPVDIDLKEIGTCKRLFQPDRSKPYVFNAEKIIKGPLYEGKFGGTRETVLAAIAVPDGYKDVPKKVYRSISPEEVATVEKLAKEQLLRELKKQKEVGFYGSRKVKTVKLIESDLLDANLATLEKITGGGEVIYIGVFYFGKGQLDNGRALFSVRRNVVNFITFYDGLSISGMLDMDGSGEEELIVVKRDPDLENDITIEWMEIYKQQKDGSWMQIIKTEKHPPPQADYVR